MGIEFACDRCGGIAVTREAWAEWDVEHQHWVLVALFDYAFCHQCHRDARLVERAHEAGPAARPEA